MSKASGTSTRIAPTRRVVLVTLVALAVATAAAVSVAAWEASRVRFLRPSMDLRVGQTREEVHRLMGRPPGTYTTARHSLPRDPGNSLLNNRGRLQFEAWAGHDCGVYVWFDGERPAVGYSRSLSVAARGIIGAG